MTASVPLYPPLPDWKDVTSTKIIRARTMYEAALLNNWNNGRGAMLVPAYFPYFPGDGIDLDAGANKDFRFYVARRYTAIDLMWCVTARATSANRTAEFTLKAPYDTGTAVTYQTSGKRDRVKPVMYRQNLAAQSDTANEIGINIAAVTNDLTIESICCWEVPRLNLGVSAAEGGVDLESEQYRQPIYTDTAKSAGGLGNAIVDSLDSARRVGMISWAVGSTLTSPGALSFTSAITAEDIFDASIPILGRKKYNPSTTIDVTCAVLARTDANGTTGTVTFTADSGDTCAITVNPGASYATFAWLTGTLTIDCEDTAELDGLQAGAWDGVNVDVIRTSGAGTIYVAAVSIFEP